MVNYLKIKGLFKDIYLYIDVQYEDMSYEIDSCFQKYDYRLFFKTRFIRREFIKPDCLFRICMLKVRHKHQDRIQNIFNKLNNNLLIIFNQEYKDFLEYFNNDFIKLLDQKAISE